MQQIVLIIVVTWVALMALSLPLMLVVGRAAQRADARAGQDHHELQDAVHSSAREAYALERTKKPNRRAAS